MAPGFALILLAVALAATAPIILLAAIAFCLSKNHRPQALRWLLTGFIGGVVTIAGFALLTAIVARHQPQATPEIFFVLFCAGFSTPVILRGALRILISRWQKRRSPA